MVMHAKKEKKRTVKEEKQREEVAMSMGDQGLSLPGTHSVLKIKALCPRSLQSQAKPDTWSF